MPPPTPPPVHQLLLASGIEFIEQSVADFPNDNYKFSVIHFGSGIEVIMKARICQKDYRLLLGKKHKNASEATFRKGECYTIGPEKCMQVLTEDLAVVLPENGKHWKELANFRNRAIHFVLDGVDDQLRLLHYNGFYDLKTFILKQRLPFKPFQQQLKSLDNALGTLVKQRYAPHIDDLYRLLENRMIRVQRQIELTGEVFRSVANLYFSLTEKTSTVTLGEIAKVSRTSSKSITENQRIYRRYGNELSRVSPTDEPVKTAFVLEACQNSSDINFIEFQLAYRWPRIQYYASGQSWASPSIVELKQTPLRWPAEKKRNEATRILKSISRRITVLKRQQELLDHYHEGLRQRSFT